MIYVWNLVWCCFDWGRGLFFVSNFNDIFSFKQYLFHVTFWAFGFALSIYLVGFIDFTMLVLFAFVFDTILGCKLDICLWTTFLARL
jgi:hypothetical protein